MNYTRNLIQGGMEEIVFPVLAPRDQVTVAYLYYPPLMFKSTGKYVPTKA
jgi:hypothetical protein